MFWRVIGVIAVIWLAFMVVGAVVHLLLPLAVLALVVTGIVSVVKWLGSGRSKTSV